MNSGRHEADSQIDAGMAEIRNESDVLMDGKHVDFTLDTGAVNADFDPAFAKAFSFLVKKGTPENQSIEDLGGKI